MSHGDHNGFTALGKKIGTSKSTLTDSNYVTEHQVLKYLRIKIAHYYLHDYRSALSLKGHVNHEQTMCKPECMTCMPRGAGRP